MLPELLGVSVYFSLWIVAALVAGWAAWSMIRAAGLPSRPAVGALAALVIVIIVGSKLYFLAGYFLFPSVEGALYSQEEIAALLRQGYRIPGGILLAAPAMPLICWLFGLPTLRFADAMTPALGIAAFFVRLGCFMNGCCHGHITGSLLGVQFPIGSKAYEAQLLTHEVAWPATQTLPVHPLQLYYAAAGLTVYLLGRRWQATKQFDGEVWAKCYALFFATTFVLEFLRAQTVYINLIVPPVVVLIALAALARGRQGRPVAIHAAP